MSFDILENGENKLFAIIVDINSFTKMVAKPNAILIAQFTRDVLAGGINAVEKSGGNVVGFMGDAFLAIHKDAEKVFKCCIGIARDLDKICDYISNTKNAFPFSPKGPSLKIGIEYGFIDISDISSKFLGTQKLFIGEPINYAARIMEAGFGNRCNIGPNAYNKGLKDFIDENDGPFLIEGKKGENTYTYYELDLGDIWREGDSKESYWD
jgi:class 3 adenylate cyclase